MRRHHWVRLSGTIGLLGGALLLRGEMTVPLVTWTNSTIRVMAANLTGNAQRYEPFALRIFQGLAPDIVAIQEFNYGDDSAAAIRQMVTATLGAGFDFYREANPRFDIPNGIISRFPIRQSGSWSDPVLSNRGFAWAKIDLPGTNDLHVVSVHFKASSGADNVAKRASEAASLKALIQSQFPPGAWVVVAGDLNTQNRSETALATLTRFLNDAPIPTDAIANGDPDTNEPRSRPYDYVLPNFTFSTNQAPVTIGPLVFPSGLVFDSRVFPVLSAVTPVQLGDSGLAQHMAVVKDFQITYSLTNEVTLAPPRLSWLSPQVIHWQSPSNLTFTIEHSWDLNEWHPFGTVFSPANDYYFTNQANEAAPRFFRVSYP